MGIVDRGFNFEETKQDCPINRNKTMNHTIKIYQNIQDN